MFRNCHHPHVRSLVSDQVQIRYDAYHIHMHTMTTWPLSSVHRPLEATFPSERSHTRLRYPNARHPSPASPTFCTRSSQISKYLSAARVLLLSLSASREGRPVDAVATALVFFHKFFMLHSFHRHERLFVGSACLFLAAKVEVRPPL